MLRYQEELREHMNQEAANEAEIERLWLNETEKVWTCPAPLHDMPVPWPTFSPPPLSQTNYFAVPQIETFTSFQIPLYAYIGIHACFTENASLCVERC